MDKLQNHELKTLQHALDTIKSQKEQIDDLSYKLVGVMLSVDKWLDGDELKQDEVNRAFTMREKALQIIESQQAENEKLEELVDEMGDYFPACIDCDGKDNFGARTDKCVYLIDKTNFCAKQGIKNIASIQKENHSLKCELKTAKTKAYKEFADGLEKSILSQLGISTMEKAEAYYYCLDCIKNLRQKLIERKE